MQRSNSREFGKRLLIDLRNNASRVIKVVAYCKFESIVACWWFRVYNWKKEEILVACIGFASSLFDRTLAFMRVLNAV